MFNLLLNYLLLFHNNVCYQLVFQESPNCRYDNLITIKIKVLYSLHILFSFCRQIYLLTGAKWDQFSLDLADKDELFKYHNPCIFQATKGPLL
jgi:hypothetical protein